MNSQTRNLRPERLSHRPCPRKYAGFTRNSRREANISFAALLDGADKPVIKPMVDFINEFGFVLPKACE
jgi:hypothetical protein